MKLIEVVLVSLSLALAVRGSQLRGYHVETFRHSADGQHLLLRTLSITPLEASCNHEDRFDGSETPIIVILLGQQLLAELVESDELP